MNEYEYLRAEALRLAKIGRTQIPQAEERFYNAIYKLKETLYRAQIFDHERIIDDLIGYPVTLRATMDSTESAHEMLRLAMVYKRMEAISNDQET